MNLGCFIGLKLCCCFDFAKLQVQSLTFCLPEHCSKEKLEILALKQIMWLWWSLEKIFLSFNHTFMTLLLCLFTNLFVGRLQSTFKGITLHNISNVSLFIYWSHMENSVSTSSYVHFYILRVSGSALKYSLCVLFLIINLTIDVSAVKCRSNSVETLYEIL